MSDLVGNPEDRFSLEAAHIHCEPSNATYLYIVFSRFFKSFLFCIDVVAFCDSEYMSRVVRKPAFCRYENKDADQLRGDPEADQRLCFRFIDSTIPLVPTESI